MVRSPEIKKIFDQGLKKESEADVLHEKDIEAFNKNLKDSLRQTIEKSSIKLCKMLENTKMEESEMSIIIHNSLIRQLQPFFNPSNVTERTQLYKNVLLFMSMNLSKKNAGELYLKHFKLDKCAAKVIEDIENSEDLRQVSVFFWGNALLKEIKRENDRLHSEADKLFKEIKELEGRYQREKNIDELNRIKKQHDEKNGKYSLYAKSINSRN